MLQIEHSRYNLTISAPSILLKTLAFFEYYLNSALVGCESTIVHVHLGIGCLFGNGAWSFGGLQGDSLKRFIRAMPTRSFSFEIPLSINSALFILEIVTIM